MIGHRVKKGPPLPFPEILIFAGKRLTDKHEIVIIIQAPIAKYSCTNTLNVISVTKSKKDTAGRVGIFRRVSGVSADVRNFLRN